MDAFDVLLLLLLDMCIIVNGLFMNATLLCLAFVDKLVAAVAVTTTVLLRLIDPMAPIKVSVSSSVLRSLKVYIEREWT